MTSPNRPSSRHYVREAEATRDRLAQSLDELSDRLTPGQVFDEMLTYAKGGGGTFFRAFSNAARENPVPSLLIGAGCMMFLSEKMGLNRFMPHGNGADGGANRAGSTMAGAGDSMSSAASRVGGVAASGASSMAQSVRSGMRGAADFASEQASAAGDGIRQGAAAIGDTVTATARNLRGQASGGVDQLAQGAHSVAETVQDYSTAVGRQVSESADMARGQAVRAATQAKDAAKSLINEQPLLCAALGLAVGAAIAAMLPQTETEDQLMGEASDSVKKAVGEVASEQLETVKTAAGNVAEEAKAAAEREGLTPAGAADVARNVGEKIKQVVADTGAVAGSEVRDFTKPVDRT
jgi:hypothetical protein